MHPERKRFLYGLATAVVVFELLYIVFMNAWIRQDNFLEQISINGRPEKLFIQLDSPKTYWPGQILLKGFEISGHDGQVKWKLKTGRVHAQLTLSSLLERTLQVDSVNVDDAEVTILLGQEKLPPSPPSKKDPFRLKFANLSINNLTRVQLQEHIYEGHIDIDGAFELWPGRMLNIWDVELDVQSGSLRHDTRLLLGNLHGTLAGSMRDYDPRQDKKLEVLDQIKRASLDLSGDLSEGVFLDWYLKDIGWLGVKELEGKLHAKIEVTDGNVASGTTGQVDATKMGLMVGPYSSQGRALVKWNVDGGKLQMSTALKNYQFLSPKLDQPFMQGSSLTLFANTETLNLKKMFSTIKDLEVGLHVNKAKVTDLHVLNDFIPVEDKFKIIGGSAELDSKLYLSTRYAAPKGYLSLKTSNTETQFRDAKFRGDIDFSCAIQDRAKGIDVFEITNAKLRIQRVNLEGASKKIQKKIDDWKGVINISKAYIRPEHNVVASGNFQMRYDNAEPFLIALGQEIRLVRILRYLAAVDYLSGKGSFQIGPKLLAFDNVKLNSSDVDLMGRYQFYKQKHKFLLWFQYDSFKAAVEYDGQKSSHALNNTLRWFETRGKWPTIELQRRPQESNP